MKKRAAERSPKPSQHLLCKSAAARSTTPAFKFDCSRGWTRSSGAAVVFIFVEIESAGVNGPKTNRRSETTRELFFYFGPKLHSVPDFTLRGSSGRSDGVQPVGSQPPTDRHRPTRCYANQCQPCFVLLFFFACTRASNFCINI